MFVERHADLLRVLGELVARHLSSEALVLHLLGHGAEVHLIERPIGPHQRNRDDEAAHLVAGVDGPRQVGRARNAGVVAVAQDGLDQLLGIASRSDFLRDAFTDAELNLLKGA